MIVRYLINSLKYFIFLFIIFMKVSFSIPGHWLKYTVVYSVQYGGHHPPPPGDQIMYTIQAVINNMIICAY